MNGAGGSNADTAADLRGRTLVMSGGSRGIGLAIALEVARLGGNVVLLAKTDRPHPNLPGTIHTAAAEIEAAGGGALAVVGDVRNAADITRAVDAAVDRFGGVDICVNNASVLATDPTEALSTKRLDLLLQIQLRGTFLLTQACLPHLRHSPNGHVLTLSPPLNLAPQWLGRQPAYTLSKYGMTLLALSWAAEYAEAGVASNALWPQTLIATAAVSNHLGGDEAMARARSPQIMADAATALFRRPARTTTGRAWLDVDVLAEAGMTDLSGYGGAAPIYDAYVDPPAADQV